MIEDNLGVFVLVGLLVLFWLLLYFYFTRNFSYWKTRNVPFPKPLPFVGNALDVFLMRKSIGDLCNYWYSKSDAPFLGLFITDDPYLLVRDLELIKTILIKDFSSFFDRSISEHKDIDPLGSHLLFLLKNPDWRAMRQKIVPVFSTGRMKWMYPLIGECSRKMVKYLDTEIGEDSCRIFDTRDVAAKYTTDAITSASFGLNANCFTDKNAEFRKVSDKIFNWKYLERGIATTAYFLAPNLVKFFRLKFIDGESAKFLRKVFWETIRQREESGVIRNDLIHILKDIRKTEAIDDPFKLEGDKLLAQAVQFFIAGYETTSTTISFTLYELALNPKLQEKVREEIYKFTKKYGGIDYDALNDMNLLDCCIKETLRKYPALPFLDRRCNRNYTIPNTDIVLKKNTAVFIPTLGIHYDPKYFPNPEKYEPDRFLKGNTIHPMTYLPFGDGPRNCIGARFGTMSSKSGVANIVANFSLEICEKTQNPMKIDPKGFLVAPIGGLPLRIHRISNKS